MADNPTESGGAQSAGGAIPEEPLRRTTSQSLADILTVLMRTPPYRDMPLRDLEWLVVPPLSYRQFALAHATKNEEQPSANGSAEGDAQKSTPPVPVGLVMWALVSKEVDAKLRADKATPVVPLSAQDWRSGDIPWIIVAAGVPQMLKAIISQSVEHAFKGQPAHMRVADKDGFRVETLKPQPKGSA